MPKCRRERRRPRRAIAPLLSLLHSPSGDEEALEHVSELLPSSAPFVAAEVVAAGEPVLVHDAWPPAIGWSWAEVRRRLHNVTLDGVVLTTSRRYMPGDAKAALQPLLAPVSNRHRTHNLSAELVLDALEYSSPHHSEDRAARRAAATVAGSRQPLDGQRLVWFDVVPAPLRPMLQAASSQLYATDWDAKQGLQYAWLSSPGMRTHTHFDNDRNFFVQLLGTKRFVVWPPNETESLCPFPRLHPLWHKSRADFEAPDAFRASSPCANYTRAAARAFTIRPGDVLYLPPFWWHTVETLGTPSLSLSTLSRWPQLYNHMNALYTHEFFHDLLHHHDARVFGLRAFVAQIVRKAQQPNLLDNLIRRYDGFEHAAARDDARSWACALDARGTPTCRWCLSRVNFDVTLAWDEHLTKLPADVRAVVLPELIEELTADLLGPAGVLAFWRDCFGPRSPPFFLTARAGAEHERLWRTRG